MHRYLRVGLLLVLLLPLSCGKKAGLPLAPVSGRITMDKKPLAKAQVRFQPANPQTDPALCPESYGETDEQGNYSLKPVGARANEQGAVVGNHIVQVSIFERESPTGPRELIPAKYSSGTALTFTVPPEGTKEANFDLTSK